MYVKVVSSLKTMFEGHNAYQKQLDQILQTSIEPKQSHSGAIIRGVGIPPKNGIFCKKSNFLIRLRYSNRYQNGMFWCFLNGLEASPSAENLIWGLGHLGERAKNW